MDAYLKQQIVEAARKLNCQFEMNKMTFENGNEEGTIEYFDGGFLEIKIVNKENDSIDFYQQIEMSHEKEMIEIMQAFYKYLYELDHRQMVDDQHIKKVVGKKWVFEKGQEPRYPNILVSCSSGASSSYYAYLITSRMMEYGIEIKADGIDYTSIQEVADQYDVIFLAPQVTYKLKEFRKLYGENKVYPLKSLEYATGNTNEIVNHLIKEE